MPDVFIADGLAGFKNAIQNIDGKARLLSDVGIGAFTSVYVKVNLLRIDYG